MVRLRYCRTLKEGIVFGANPLRWLPVFIVDSLFFSILVCAVFAGSGSHALELLSSPAGIGGIAFILAAWFLARLWIVGGVIHQARKEKDFNKCWKISLEKFPSLLGAMALVLAISVLLGLVPFINQLLTIIVGVAFFFSLQSVVVKNKSALDALKESYSIFRRRMNPMKLWDSRCLACTTVVVLLGLVSACVHYYYAFFFGYSALFSAGLIGFWITLSALAFLLFYSTVFRIWVVVAVISGIISIIFSLPALALGFSSLSTEILLLGKGGFQAVVLYFLSNPSNLFLAGIVFLVGSSISTAFSLKVQTDSYLRLRKRFGFL